MVLIRQRESVKELSIEAQTLVGPASDTSISATSKGTVPIPLKTSFKKVVFVAVAQLDTRAVDNNLRLMGFFYDPSSTAVQVVFYNTSTAAVTVASNSITAAVVIFGY